MNETTEIFVFIIPFLYVPMKIQDLWQV